MRETTSSASKTTAITTAVNTRFEELEDELLLEDLTDAGTLAPGVFAGRVVTDELWKFDRPDATGAAGTTNVDEDLTAFFAVFLTAFFAVFLTAFLAIAFFAVLFFAEVFFAVLFFAEVFLAAFFAVFLTATVVLLGLYLKSRFKIQ
ncbi:MAG: hypothetical protein F2672_01540 [Actinobacteria bacterium]|nr:hypothetical protein [Actinomycetota bacterium]